MEADDNQSAEASMIDFNDGPSGSSPFVAEVGSVAIQSRTPGKQYKPDFTLHENFMEEEEDLFGANSPKAEMERLGDAEQKENMLPGNSGGKAFLSPSKRLRATTPEPMSRPSSRSHDIMAPPSTRKSATLSPIKTPLKPAHDHANTAWPPSRDSPFERSPRKTTDLQTAGTLRGFVTRPDDGGDDADDTCFTAFSEIPDMTLFARAGASPTKTPHSAMSDAPRTPRITRKRASPSRSPSPTPRKLKSPSKAGARDETTSFLIDFTQQIEGIGRSDGASLSPSKTAGTPNLLQYMHNQRSPAKPQNHLFTPSKPNPIFNLLDWEPPAPTPRSVPTITVRELETLKSSHHSQLSSLEATLSGRYATPSSPHRDHLH